MAIIINGETCRTLRQPVYVKGQQIKEAYVDGKLCYPEDLPEGEYVLRLSGDIAQPYQIGEMTKFGSYSWWSGWGDTTFTPVTRSMFGHVDMVIVSKTPIAVYQQTLSVNTSDLSNEYHAGTVYKYGRTIWGGGANSTPNGFVNSFPTLHPTVGYYLTSGESHRGSSIAGCTSPVHISYAVWGFNTCKSMDECVPSSSVGGVYKYGNHTDMAWLVAQNKEYVKGYHGVTTGPDFKLSTAMLTSSAAGRTVTSGIRVGITLPAWWYGPFGESWSYSKYRPIAWVPFTKVEYNNNPPVTSKTFSSDPPTEKASDDQRVPIEIIHSGLSL